MGLVEQLMMVITSASIVKSLYIIFLDLDDIKTNDYTKGGG
jgi:hypothetical protein